MLRFRNNEVIGPKEHADLISGRAVFLVWGRIKYRDAFRVVHTRRFGMWFNPDTGMFTYPRIPAYNADEPDYKDKG
jgi:hypothetical protein